MINEYTFKILRQDVSMPAHPLFGLKRKQSESLLLGIGPILSKIYNCTKHGNWKIDNATTAHFTLHISIFNCTSCDQLHVKICPALLASMPIHGADVRPIFLYWTRVWVPCDGYRGGKGRGLKERRSEFR